MAPEEGCVSFLPSNTTQLPLVAFPFAEPWTTLSLALGKDLDFEGGKICKGESVGGGVETVCIGRILEVSKTKFLRFYFLSWWKICIFNTEVE
jgi:hypothetical protein